MESLSMTSVSLPIMLVGRILEEWLNANRFKVAHQVTGVDVIDAYDREAGVVHVDLALAQPPTVKSVEERALALGQAHLVEVGTNGHGGSAKNGGGATPVKMEVAPELPSASRKRRPPITPEQRQQVIELHLHGIRPGLIARQLDLGDATIFDVLKATVAEQPKTHKMPHCSACGVRAACMQSVIAGGDFARAECREAEL